MIKGGAQLRANLKIFRLLGEGARRRAALSLHSTAQYKLCNKKTCPYKPSHDYEYTGTHKSLLREILRIYPGSFV